MASSVSALFVCHNESPAQVSVSLTTLKAFFLSGFNKTRILLNTNNKIIGLERPVHVEILKPRVLM